MALTELQLPTKAAMYRDVQSLAGEMASRMLRWKEASDFLEKLTADDLTAMSVPEGQLWTDLVEFRTVLGYFVTLYGGTAVTPALNPGDVMDKMRTMLIV